MAKELTDREHLTAVEPVVIRDALDGVTSGPAGPGPGEVRF